MRQCEGCGQWLGAKVHTCREKQTILDRIEDKFLVGDGCWEWTGAKNGWGYGNVYLGGWPEPRYGPAHKVVYELLVGPVPEGLELDHQCHNRDKSCPGGKRCLHRRCVNPGHLEPSTGQENNSRGQSPSAQQARQEECIHGHAFDEENTYRHKGHRHCRKCRKVNRQRSAQKKRAER